MNFTVSVIIPVFNGQSFVEKAINSVLLQEEVSEIIVINDGSNDATYNILNRLQKNNAQITILEHPDGKRLGRSASRNLGICSASNEFIAFLDADDYFLPGRFTLDKKKI